jgi:GLPGLI family protein
MKKTIQLLLILFALSNTINAQDFQGKAIYKSIRNMEKMNFQMEGGDPVMEQRMKEMLKKQMEKEFELAFDKQSSVYKKQEELESSAQQSGGGMVMIFTENGENGVLYKNTQEKRFASTRDVFGKEFLVKDKLKPIEWKLGKETKQIGNYTCYNATYEREQRTMVFISDDSEENDAPKETLETITVTVWYTPDIPVAHGPSMLWGLPGLIMEVQDGNLKTICTEVIINPTEKITLAEPNSGKVINEEKYEKIMHEKMDEMEKMNKGGRKKGDAHNIEITIEG